jgi:D-threo-aldose 1-dehydrogenase
MTMIPVPADPATRRGALLQRLRDSGPFGFGASSLGNLYEPMSEEQALDTVAAAWDGGVRLFDTAPFYGFGLSEQRLGLALSSRPRDTYLLSTKVGRLLVPDEGGGTAHGFRDARPFRPVLDYGYDGVMRSFEASLERLGVDRIDLLLMHDIGRATHRSEHERHWRDAVDGGFRALAALRDQGVVGGVGLGVNELAVCAAAIERFDPDLFLIAGRYTLLEREGEAFFERCSAAGIGILAAGVFNSGILATGTSGAGPARFDYDEAAPEIRGRVAAIEAICAAHGVPLAVAAHRFVRTSPAVTQTLLGLRDPRQVEAALAGCRLPIPPGFWAAIDALD